MNTARAVAACALLVLSILAPLSVSAADDGGSPAATSTTAPCWLNVADRVTGQSQCPTLTRIALTSVAREERRRRLPVSKPLETGRFDSEKAVLKLCNSNFKRLSNGEMNQAWKYAGLKYATGIPAGEESKPPRCTVGCVIGNGLAARVARASAPEQSAGGRGWIGKCFTNTRDEYSGTGEFTVGNRISYGTDKTSDLYDFLTFPGAGFYRKKSKFGTRSGTTYSAVVDYKSYPHEFEPFYDEIRPLYPGVYIGKVGQRSRNGRVRPLTMFLLFETDTILPILEPPDGIE